MGCSSEVRSISQKPAYRKRDAVMVLEALDNPVARRLHPTWSKYQNRVRRGQFGGVYYIAHNFMGFKDWNDNNEASLDCHREMVP